jgi:hypothetical protein
MTRLIVVARALVLGWALCLCAAIALPAMRSATLPMPAGAGTDRGDGCAFAPRRYVRIAWNTERPWVVNYYVVNLDAVSKWSGRTRGAFEAVMRGPREAGVPFGLIDGLEEVVAAHSVTLVSQRGWPFRSFESIAVIHFDDGTVGTDSSPWSSPYVNEMSWSWMAPWREPVMVRPLWRGAVLNAFVGAPVIAAIIVGLNAALSGIWAWLRSSRFDGIRRCATCGYDVVGLTRCPECGRPVSVQATRAERAGGAVSESIAEWSGALWRTVGRPVWLAWCWSPAPGASAGVRALAWARTLAFAALGCVIAAWLAYAISLRL